jgi:hypothetical protein
MPDLPWSQLATDTTIEEDYNIVVSDVSVSQSKQLILADFWGSLRSLTAEASVVDTAQLLLQRGTSTAKKVTLANLRSLFTDELNQLRHVTWAYLAPDSVSIERGYLYRGSPNGTLTFISPTVGGLPYMARLTGTGDMYVLRLACHSQVPLGYARWWIRTPTLTDARIFLGVGNTAIPWTGDSLGGSVGMFFRYSTSAGDTSWRCLTRSTAEDSQLTGVVPEASNAHKFEVAWVYDSAVQYFIDDVLVHTVTTANTLNFADNNFSQPSGMRALTGASSSIDIGLSYCITAWP